MTFKLLGTLTSTKTILLVVFLAAPEPDLHVRLNARKRDYLLGEPITLHLAVQNTGASPVEMEKPVVVRGLEPDISIELSRDGGRSYAPYKAGIYPAPKVVRQTDSLRPGDQWAFALKVLFSAGPGTGLALEQPGEYHIRTIYPVFQGGARSPIESNPVRVRVVQPVGGDVKVWQALNTRASLYFLHTAEHMPQQSSEGVVLRLIGVVESVPGSKYDMAIRDALGTYFERECDSLPPIETTKLRRVLARHNRGFCLEDRRLDMVVSDGFTATPLREVLRQVENVAGVPLSVEGDLGKHEMTSIARRTELRNFMQQLAKGTRATWESRGSGYVLVVANPGAHPRLHPSVLFPDDRRLGQFVDAEIRGRHLSEVIASLSQQSGVPLRPDEPLERPWPGLGNSELRVVMSFMSQLYNATWFPEGDGYVLRHNIPPERRMPTKMDVRK